MHAILLGLSYNIGKWTCYAGSRTFHGLSLVCVSVCGPISMVFFLSSSLFQFVFTTFSCFILTESGIMSFCDYNGLDLTGREGVVIDCCVISSRRCQSKTEVIHKQGEPIQFSIFTPSCRQRILFISLLK